MKDKDKDKETGSIILPLKVRTNVRTFLSTIADKIKKTPNQEIFEIEGEKYILYTTTGTFKYPVPLYPTVKAMLVDIFTKNLQFPQIGTDESGKGDVFGPLVVAGALIDKDNIPALIDIGIKDSKKISDSGIEKLKSRIKGKFLYDVVLITPKKYNELHNKMKSVNNILAWAHARVIENLLKKKRAHLIIIDMFADPEFIKSYMFEKARDKDFIIESRAEKHLSPALASIIARIHYLEYMKKMEKKYNMIFPKGAGLETSKAISEFIKKHGKEKLPEVAKIHFRNIKQFGNGSLTTPE